MKNIIGIGTVGTNIARKFERYENYNVYKVDSIASKEAKYLKIPRYDSHEEYEKKKLPFGKFFDKTERALDSISITFFAIFFILLLSKCIFKF